MKSASRETQLLRQASGIIDRFVRELPTSKQQETRFQILEAVASRFGGFDLADYQKTFKRPHFIDRAALLELAREILKSLEITGIPPSLAVSALAREALDVSSKRRSGAYHTDFRLAQHLANLIGAKYRTGIKVVDPACGAGILLAALTIATCGADRKLTNTWLAKSVYAADLSENALRGALIALACHTDDVGTLFEMRSKWRVQDSLLAGSEAWQDDARGFDVVVANPPWEKVKLTRHEFLQSQGVQRHYGAVYAEYDQEKYDLQKEASEAYGAKLFSKYASLRYGEPDLYVAFAELLIGLAKPGGAAGLLLPAGLIRSQSTEYARKLLLEESNKVTFEVFENRARFFEIDTRFKFLAVVARKKKGTQRDDAIELGHARGTPLGVVAERKVRIGRAALASLRPDFSLPEVKSYDEWQLFSKMNQKGVVWSEQSSPWHPHFMREVDMTRDRGIFRSKAVKSAIPLVEGRMVHQHRFGVKSYRSGTGRSAVWDVNAPGISEIKPQFWVSSGDLPQRVAERTRVQRVGFCDITGQTNERSCLAAMIPPGNVCGNKVPTILFPNDPRDCRLWLWIAFANSIPFDWMLRRVITTTVNYFHLLSLPLPPVEPDTLPGRTLVDLSQRISRLDHGGGNRSVNWQIAELRAKADAMVLNAYGLSVADLDVMMNDFPLIDRVQPSISGEEKSTITRDLIVSYLKKGHQSAKARARAEAAKKCDAVAYVPTQMSDAEQESGRREVGNG